MAINNPWPYSYPPQIVIGPPQIGPYSTTIPQWAPGCVCPPTSEQPCGAAYCPRRGPAPSPASTPAGEMPGDDVTAEAIEQLRKRARPELDRLGPWTEVARDATGENRTWPAMRPMSEAPRDWTKPRSRNRICLRQVLLRYVAPKLDGHTVVARRPLRLVSAPGNRLGSIGDDRGMADQEKWFYLLVIAASLWGVWRITMTEISKSVRDGIRLALKDVVIVVRERAD
jgi:hypothetical protein